LENTAVTMKKIRIGLLGCGTVGGGVVEILAQRGALISTRSGFELELGWVVDLDEERVAALGVPGERITRDAEKALADASVDVWIELVGGVEPARTWVLSALERGKAVVTANKKLLAECGPEVFAAAERGGAELLFEASVGGGIPLLGPMRDQLIANQIDAVTGIVNGTCNYLLTSMESQQRDLAPILAEAQRQGIAERDPSLDIDGWDSAHKVCVLARVGFGVELVMGTFPVRGIRDVTLADVQLTAALGYRIKLVGVLERRGGILRAAVAPVLVSKSSPLAGVEGANNMVLVDADQTGPTGYYGPGAGRFPTASAILADVVEAVRRRECVGLRRPLAPPVELLTVEGEDFRRAGRWMVRCGGKVLGEGWVSALVGGVETSACLVSADDAEDAWRRSGALGEREQGLVLPAPEGVLF